MSCCHSDPDQVRCCDVFLKLQECHITYCVEPEQLWANSNKNASVYALTYSIRCIRQVRARKTHKAQYNTDWRRTTIIMAAQELQRSGSTTDPMGKDASETVQHILIGCEIQVDKWLDQWTGTSGILEHLEECTAVTNKRISVWSQVEWWLCPNQWPIW